MPAGDVETVTVDGMWTNLIEGVAQDEQDWFQTRAEAEKAGRGIASALGVGHIGPRPD